MKFAFSVFINQDVPTARKLIEEKTQLRVAELGSADSHLARLREGRPESIETSSLHLDILARFKAHSLPHLLGGVSGTRSRGRVAAQSLERERRV
jgi:Na+/phosphate symporter